MRHPAAAEEPQTRWRREKEQVPAVDERGLDVFTEAQIQKLS